MAINQLAHLFMQIFGIEGVSPPCCGAKLDDLRHNYVDVGRAQEILGYEPRILLKEGLAAFVTCDQNTNTTIGNDIWMRVLEQFECG